VYTAAAVLRVVITRARTDARKSHGKGLGSGKPVEKSLLCVCVVSWPYTIYFPTPMARYSLFVLTAGGGSWGRSSKVVKMGCSSPGVLP